MKPLPWLAALLTLLIPAPALATPPLPPTVRADLQRTVFNNDQVAGYRVHNDSSVTVTGWRLEFDLPADTTIATSWNGRFARSGNHVTVQPESWNATLVPGGAVDLGWYANGTGEPANCRINGQPCDGQWPDETDPTRPTPLTIDTTGGVTLHWAASTDDRQLRHYEVYESGTLVATTTSTSYVFHTGPALPPRVYVFRVRAIDAAGNYSASAYASLGTPQMSPPPAPGRLAIAPAAAPGTQRLTWEQPLPPPVGPAPVIAGYEVSLDGTPVAVTGALRYVGPVPPTGEHTWSVRAIDALDRLSDPGQLTQTVS
ncbi:cellulose binding domain-containing protein [Nucisporomicrobium flavum]|uniref:cellulose binding domain-containing protein n=1 Tax=Nucisporomicrobium flavum TaxID=2785915 RepID=UPI0018F5085E|nr:cellulose binding domain-containing protein [Nucisporomicrobium flavum]